MGRINLAWAASRSSSSERRQKRFFESIKPKAILAVDKSARSRALIMIDWFSKTTGTSFRNGTERESARIVWTRLYFVDGVAALCPQQVQDFISLPS